MALDPDSVHPDSAEEFRFTRPCLKKNRPADVPPLEVAEAVAEVAPGRIRLWTPAFRRTNLALFSAGFVTFALLYCVQPLMPVLSAEFGVNAATASLSLSCTTAMLAISMIVISTFSDSLERKKLMGIALFSSAFLAILSSLMPTFSSLLAVRGLEGITLSGLPAIAMTYLSEEIESRSLGLAMGLYVSGTAFGGMAGRLLTGVISDLSSWRIAVFSMGGLGLVASTIFWYALPASRHFVPHPLRIRSFSRSAIHQFSDQVLPWLFLLGFLLMGAFVTVYNYIGYRLMGPPYHLSQTLVGLLFSTYLVGIFSSTWAGRLADKLGKGSVLWTMVATMFGGVLFTLAGSLVWIVLGVTVCTFGFFGGHSIASSWVAERAKSFRAQASSLYLFAYYAGSSLIGSLTGFAWGQGGWFAVVAVVALLLSTALAVAIGLRKSVPASASHLDRPN